MNLQTKASLLVFGITAVVVSVSGRFCYTSHKEMIEGTRQTQLSFLTSYIQNDLQDLTGKAAARASLVCSLPSIQEAFRAGDRDQLARRLVPAFMIQRDKYGVREGQFHLSPATSFLRVFDVRAPQEDLSGFREMVLTTNRKQAPQKGVEIGRRGLSIRGIDLVKDDKGPIGSFEVGMSFTTLLTDIKATTGFEAGVFVDDKMMSSIATEIPRPGQDKIIGNYQAVDSTNWEIIHAAVSPETLAKVNDISSKTITIGGTEYGVVMLPLLDFKGKQIGSIVAASNLESYQAQLKAALVEILFSSLLEGIVFAGAISILINLVFVRPLKKLDTALQQMAKGDPAADAALLPHSADEFGAMARSVETLRGNQLKTAATETEPAVRS